MSSLVVVELVAVGDLEPHTLLPRFAGAVEGTGLITIREWDPEETAYAVVVDPELDVFDAVEQVPGLRIHRAARLEIPGLPSAEIGELRARLPYELQGPIAFPDSPGLDPRLSVRPPKRPLVFCPNCPTRIHPAPECPEQIDS